MSDSRALANATYEDMLMEKHDQELALSFIRKLVQALANADTSGSDLNRELIQKATKLLEKYNADLPTFG
jgi:hypothetical protein